MAGTGIIELKRFHLIYLLGNGQNFRGLLDVPLHGRAMRSRNAIVKKLREFVEEQEEERLAALKLLATKDDRGEPKMLPADKGGGFDLTPEALKEFQEKYNAGMNSTVSLYVNDETRDDLRAALEILRNTSMPMDIKTSDIHEAIVKEFESGLQK